MEDYVVMRFSSYAMIKFFDWADDTCHRLCKNIESTFIVNTIEILILFFPLVVGIVCIFLEMGILRLLYRHRFVFTEEDFIDTELRNDIATWMRYHGISWQFISYSFFGIFDKFPKRWVDHDYDKTVICFRCEEDMMAFKLGFDLNKYLDETII
jgi:hypothetical protein